MPTTATYKYLSKLLKQRKYLLEARIGNCSAQVRTAYEEVKKYAEYLNSDEALKNWVRRNEEKVRLLIPRKDKNKKELDELTQILQS